VKYGMPFYFKIISSSTELRCFASDWDRFVKNHSENPFLHTAFLLPVMKNYPKREPFFLVLFLDKKIVAVAPLHLTSKFGVRFAEFFLEPHFFSDFVFDPEYFDESLQRICNFLFINLNCSFLLLVLEKTSVMLQKIRTIKGLFVSENNYSGHLVLNKPDNLVEFRKMGGKRVRKDFERTERFLNDSGVWRVLKYDAHNYSLQISKRILSVDCASWKQGWRVNKKISSDVDLLIVLDSFLFSIENPDKTDAWLAWVLELNGVPISYQIALTFKDVTYFIKTGYDNSYRQFSPGVYVLNFAIRDLLKNPETKKIDFVSDLEFLKRWKSENNQRVQLIVSYKLSAKVIQRLITNQLLNRFLKLLKFFLNF
jgi:CelD/BcsL family acetyltransferase involved in cellulose biosynthesis